MCYSTFSLLRNEKKRLKILVGQYHNEVLAVLEGTPHAYMQATKSLIDTSDKHMQTYGEANKPNQPPAKCPDSRALERIQSYSAPIAYVLVQARIRLFRNPYSLECFQIMT
jgi:hypothetical protein